MLEETKCLGRYPICTWFEDSEVCAPGRMYVTHCLCVAERATGTEEADSYRWMARLKPIKLCEGGLGWNLGCSPGDQYMCGTSTYFYFMPAALIS